MKKKIFSASVSVPDDVMLKSYSRRDLVLKSFMDDWSNMQEVERAESMGYDSFSLYLTFQVTDVPLSYMQDILKEAKRKICDEGWR